MTDATFDPFDFVDDDFSEAVFSVSKEMPGDLFAFFSLVLAVLQTRLGRGGR